MTMEFPFFFGDTYLKGENEQIDAVWRLSNWKVWIVIAWEIIPCYTINPLEEIIPHLVYSGVQFQTFNSL